MTTLFAWPEAAKVGSRIPRDRLFRAAGGSKTIKALYEEQVDRVDWVFKLFERSVNLPPRDGVREIEIIRVSARGQELDARILAHIDKALPHQTYLEIIRKAPDEHQIQVAAAYKRTSEADQSKVVTLEHWRSDWVPVSSHRHPLPQAVSLDGLYVELLRSVWPHPARAGETLRDQAERLSKALTRLRDKERFEKLVRREKSFGRQVDLNRELRTATRLYRELTE